MSKSMELSQNRRKMLYDRKTIRGKFCPQQLDNVILSRRKLAYAIYRDFCFTCKNLKLHKKKK